MSKQPKKYLFRGEMLSVAEVAALTGYDKGNLHRRIEGDRIREVKRHSRPHYITHAGKTLRLSEWSRLTGLPRGVIFYRLSNGWPVGEALTAPLKQSQKRQERARRPNA